MGEAGKRASVHKWEWEERERIQTSKKKAVLNQLKNQVKTAEDGIKVCTQIL